MTAELGPEKQAGPFLHNGKMVGATVILEVIAEACGGRERNPE